jgi:hypothetical protein
VHALRGGRRYGQGRPADHGPVPSRSPGRRREPSPPPLCAASCSAATTGRSCTATGWPSLTPATTSAPIAATSFTSAHRDGATQAQTFFRSWSAASLPPRTRLLWCLDANHRDRRARAALDELPRLHWQRPQRAHCTAHSEFRRGLCRVLSAMAGGKEGDGGLGCWSLAQDISAALRPADE